MFQFLATLVGRQKASYTKALGLLQWKTGSTKLLAKSSISAARKKVSWAFFRKLLHRVVKEIDNEIEGHLWHGHPVYGVDGTKLNLPRELKQLKYKGTHKGCFYPQGLLTTLVRLKSNIPCHFVFSRKCSETRSVSEHLKHVKEKAVVVYDRLYFSVPTLLAHKERGVHGVFRLRTGGTLKEVTDFIASDLREQIIDIHRPGLTITLRFVRYKIAGKDYFLATTLLDPIRYPLHSLKALYHSRWGIEETFKFLKQEIDVEAFHCQDPNGVKQEIAVALILTAICRVTTLKCGRSRKQGMGLAKELLIHSIPDLWTECGVVRTQVICRTTQLCQFYLHKSPPNRSFLRRSRKVINRWQRNISREWAQRKKLERQSAHALPP